MNIAGLFDGFLDAVSNYFDVPSDTVQGDGLGATSHPEWHNDFGTAADYQVPAESFSAFDDSYSTSFSSSFDSDF